MVIRVKWQSGRPLAVWVVTPDMPTPGIAWMTRVSPRPYGGSEPDTGPDRRCIWSDVPAELRGSPKCDTVTLIVILHTRQMATTLAKMPLTLINVSLTLV